MTLTVRMIPLNGAAVTATCPPGVMPAQRAYTAPAGGVVDVPQLDAQAISGAGFVAIGNGSGPTSGRPNGGLTPGYLYLDTTLNLFVAWGGSNGWVNPLTGATA